MEITADIKYLGVNDHLVDLFEGQYAVPHGMSYNSYAILDEKTAVLDTVEIRFLQNWLDNLQGVFGDKAPDYLVVHHMEPDHAGSIAAFLEKYPTTKVVSSVVAFSMMEGYFGDSYASRRQVVKEGDVLTLGKHALTFVAAPMVHWPEVMVSYDSCDKVLFSADAFGKFGALDVEEDWLDEARRYFIGIVGKFGPQVQILLGKAAGLDIKTICPLHGPVLKDNLGYYLGLYQKWSTYTPEEDGVTIAYTSVYGHTKKAVELLQQQLAAQGVKNVKVFDLARCDMSQALASAFRYSKLVLATTTYTTEIFPFMRTFINLLVEHNFQKRQVALVENGSWAPMAAKVMKALLEKCLGLTYAATAVRLKCALNDASKAQVLALAEELAK